jgi:hypothetical protein
MSLIDYLKIAGMAEEASKRIRYRISYSMDRDDPFYSKFCDDDVVEDNDKIKSLEFDLSADESSLFDNVHYSFSPIEVEDKDEIKVSKIHICNNYVDLIKWLNMVKSLNVESNNESFLPNLYKIFYTFKIEREISPGLWVRPNMTDVKYRIYYDHSYSEFDESFKNDPSYLNFCKDLVIKTDLMASSRNIISAFSGNPLLFDKKSVLKRHTCHNFEDLIIWLKKVESLNSKSSIRNVHRIEDLEKKEHLPSIGLYKIEHEIIPGIWIEPNMRYRIYYAWKSGYGRGFDFEDLLKEYCKKYFNMRLKKITPNRKLKQYIHPEEITAKRGMLLMQKYGKKNGGI